MAAVEHENAIAFGQFIFEISGGAARIDRLRLCGIPLLPLPRTVIASVSEAIHVETEQGDR
jgi:hypothetical protein